MKRFLDLADFTREEVVDLLALAQRLQDHPEPRALAGRVLGLLFLNPSLRTLSSMQAGMARLGGSSFVITPGSGTWHLETRPGVTMNGDAAEHIREGIPRARRPPRRGCPSPPSGRSRRGRRSPSAA